MNSFSIGYSTSARIQKKALGYSAYTVRESGYRAAAFDRWVWDHYDEYRIPPSHEDADEFLQEVAITRYSVLF